MYKSNKDFFDKFKILANQIKSQGNETDSERLMNSASCLNGLTDGWAIFHGRLNEIINNPTGSITHEQKKELKRMAKAINKIVRRV